MLPTVPDPTSVASNDVERLAEFPSAPTYEPQKGETVRDEAARRVGVVMGSVGPYYQLRPIGGGKEWDADPLSLRPIDQLELLSARVAGLNSRTERGGL